MKSYSVLACLALAGFIAVASVCAAEGFGEVTWAGSKFTYNGQMFDRLILVRYPGVANTIEGFEVLEMKAVMDRNVGKLYLIRTKSRIFEVPLKIIKGTMADRMDLYIDL